VSIQGCFGVWCRGCDGIGRVDRWCSLGDRVDEQGTLWV